MKKAGKNTVPTLQEWHEKDFFSKGKAVCEPRILTDTIFCRFREETFEFSSNEIVGHFSSVGQHGLPVRKLRMLVDRRLKDGR